MKNFWPFLLLAGFLYWVLGQRKADAAGATAGGPALAPPPGANVGAVSPTIPKIIPGTAQVNVKAVTVPDAMVSKMKGGVATESDYIELGDVGKWLAAEAWWYGYANANNNIMVPALKALMKLQPGFNSSPGGPPIDGEGNKKAWVLAQFAKYQGRPGIFNIPEL